MDTQYPSSAPSGYAELHAVSNFSFLRGASHPEELVERAFELGYAALALTDECSFAGVVRAHVRARELRLEAADDSASKPRPVEEPVYNPVHRSSQARPHAAHRPDRRPVPRLIVGTELDLGDGCRLVVLVTDAASYRAACALITAARRAAPKGEYALDEAMIEAAGLDGAALLLVPPYSPSAREAVEHRFGWVRELSRHAYLALELHVGPRDAKHRMWLEEMSLRHGLPLVAAGDVHMHARSRRGLQDVLACVRHGCTLDAAGRRLHPNGERHLRGLGTLASLYPADALARTLEVAALCRFDLDSLEYRYPSEVVPPGTTAHAHLRRLVMDGARWRWPDGVPDATARQLDHELDLIRTMGYESYFLTVHDVVAFARSRGILCQGRGSAANSAACFCLGITSVDPTRTRLLFERFVSAERDEPPDIDVDFEHERREEVIQYLYAKYGRRRCALAATVIRYRRRSAVRDVGRAVGLDPSTIDALAGSLAWWEGPDTIPERLAELGLDPRGRTVRRFLWLLPQILGMPRHLSQHVGGFVISEHDLATLVPVENAAMPERTIVQWDKDDLGALGLMKVDVLALGMLSAISKCFDLIESRTGVRRTLATLPPDDAATYDMICRADTVGVFQIESRAQMAMLPKLRPRTWYDLVVEISLVRPGPIQGGMVHPYLARRQGLEETVYPSEALRAVLERTLGVPVFQEQVMEIVVVAAGFTPGQADGLRRSMAAWRRTGRMERFREPVVAGMLANGYAPEFAESLFRQIEGFGEYGFPESHAASFAMIVYASCWLKCHEPAAFLCAMLNSQPLGFYSPSELVQDARRHGVTVLPVDVNASLVDHALVDDPHGVAVDLQGRPRDAVRLGLRLVASLSAAGAARTVAAREAGPYVSAEDLVRRAELDARDRGALAAAGALERVAGHRHRASWALLGIEARADDLLDEAAAPEPENLELPFPTEGEDVVEDYRSTGLTLRRHPLALLRARLTARRLTDSATWRAAAGDGDPVRLAGLVTMRQRPGSAKGTMFVTLEDEHGTVDVILWPDVVERYRSEAIGARLLAVSGTTQRAHGKSALLARRLGDLSGMLSELSGIGAVEALPPAGGPSRG